MFVLLSLFATLSVGADLGPFVPKCEIPFSKIKKDREIDRKCGLDGKSSNESNLLQNRMKNELCAKGGLLSIEISDFTTLQEKANDKHIAHGRNHLPQDRSELRQLTQIRGNEYGEGKVVSLVGYLVDPHCSDVKEGESVNCKIPGEASNDIHMNVSATPMELPRGKKSKSDKEERTKLLCQTIVAEVIPHFRPEAWEAENLRKTAKNGYPVRVTGQLFFDASHNPCRDGKVGRGDPARASLWEIHPVYQLEVCELKNLEQCKKESRWKPIR